MSQTLISKQALPNRQSRPTPELLTAIEPEGSNRQKLEAAFDFFNQMSEQLSQSYHALEQQVEVLTSDLADAQTRHQQDVAARDRATGRLEGLLDVLPVGVVVLDVRGRVTQANQAAIDLLGEPLLEQLWLNIIRRCFEPRADDGIDVSLKDGRRVSIATRSLQVEPGQLIVLTDMTETRAMQHRLNHHQRLSELGKMVASLAHQIRTPLSAAMLYAEHLAEPELSPQQHQRFSAKLQSRLQHLELQVRDMLIFARGEMPLADISTTERLEQDLLSAMDHLLVQTDSVCHLDNQASGCTLSCNHEALVSALMNLVNNAVQAVGRHAFLRILMTATADDRLVISVADQGPGIDPAMLERVMDPFVSTKSQGTGLGLSVVQAVARAHHGQMDIESSPGQGTRVTLWLPLRSKQ